MAKGYNEKEPSYTGLEQLQTIQLEERALQSNNIWPFPPETFLQSCHYALPILMANIIMACSKQQDTEILCRTGYYKPLTVSIQSV